MNQITINVVGSAGAGKSTISNIIKKALEEQGFTDVNLVTLEGETENECVLKTLDERSQRLKELNSSITVKEVQLIRNSH